MKQRLCPSERGILLEHKVHRLNGATGAINGRKRGEGGTIKRGRNSLKSLTIFRLYFYFRKNSKAVANGEVDER